MSDYAAMVRELDELCRNARSAESELNAASELASEDSVDSARERWSRAHDALRSRVPAIGAALFDEGGEAAMHTALEMVDEKHRGTVSTQWQGIGGFSG